MTRTHAFTLIELLIVVAIIGILAAIAIPNFQNAQIRAKYSRCLGDMKACQTALESYYIHNNAYPASLNLLVDAAPRIIGVLPLDPFNVGNNYGYNVSSNGNHFVVFSIGPSSNGAAQVSDSGDVSETNSASCIFASGSDTDTTGP